MFVRPEPSAFTTKICHHPLRFAAKAIREPSGESAGQRSGAASFVRRLAPVPSTAAT